MKSMFRGLMRHFDAVLSRVTFVLVTIMTGYEPIMTFVFEPTTAPPKFCRSEQLFDTVQLGLSHFVPRRKTEDVLCSLVVSSYTIIYAR